jgi:hypothetical protein
MVEMLGLWVLPLIALLATVVLIVYIYQRTSMNLPSTLWVLILFFFIFWAVGEFAQKWLGEDLSVLRWMLLCIMFGDIFPAIFLVFVLLFPTPASFFTRNQKLLMVLIIVPKVVSTVITASLGNYSKPADWDEWWSGSNFGYYPFILALRHIASDIGDWYFYLGVAHTVLLLGIGTIMLIWNMVYSEVKDVRDTCRMLLIGLLIFTLVGASTGLMLPIFGYFPPELYSLGMLMLHIVVALGLLRGQVLLFSPIVEIDSESTDYSESLQMGQYYMSSKERGIETFTSLVNRGYEGLYVGAIKPNLELTKFKRTPIVILTEAGKGLRQYGNLQYVPADELKTFKASIMTFVRSASRGIIFLDNMDVILDKGWAHPKEFVELGMQMNTSGVMNAIWLFGTAIKDDDRIDRVRTVMDFPVVKKATVLDKLNRIITRTDIDSIDLDNQLKRLGRVEPIFYYLVVKDGALSFNEDITHFNDILEMEPTNVIRLFIQQFQSQIPSEVYREILEELQDYGISRFEFLLRPGDSYLIEETFHDRGRTYDVYLDLLDRGFAGMCITRTEPNKLRHRYLLPPENAVYWLTQDRKEEFDIRPAPEYLYVNIKNFLEAHQEEPGVILLDGLEYLITFQGDQFDAYLRVMRRIADLISQTKVVLLIPYDPEAIIAERVALFRRSGIEVITRHMLT